MKKTRSHRNMSSQSDKLSRRDHSKYHANPWGELKKITEVFQKSFVLTDGSDETDVA